MPDQPIEPTNPVLELLRAIRADTAALRYTRTEHGHRLARLEIGVAALRRDQANDAETAALTSVRMDDLSERVERIETRLGPWDA